MSLAMSDWREALAIHQAAWLLPSVKPEEIAALADDIKANGLQHNVLVIRVDGKPQLVDGRNRLDAMQQLGYRFEVLDDEFYFTAPDGRESKADLVPDGVDPDELALSLNVYRRHLTSAQKRAVIAKRLEMRPELSDRAIGAEAADGCSATARLDDCRWTMAGSPSSSPLSASAAPAARLPGRTGADRWLGACLV
jgi:hypothetical protein